MKNNCNMDILTNQGLVGTYIFTLLYGKWKPTTSSGLWNSYRRWWGDTIGTADFSKQHSALISYWNFCYDLLQKFHFLFLGKFCGVGHSWCGSGAQGAPDLYPADMLVVRCRAGASLPGSRFHEQLQWSELCKMMCCVLHLVNFI